MSDSDMIDELFGAEDANMHQRQCQVCSALQDMGDDARSTVQRALAGTIGARKLAEILTRNGYPTGRRAVDNHRLEGTS